MKSSLHDFPSLPLVDLAGRLGTQGRRVIDREAVASFTSVNVQEGVQEGKTVVLRLGSEVV